MSNGNSNYKAILKELHEKLERHRIDGSSKISKYFIEKGGVILIHAK